MRARLLAAAFAALTLVSVASSPLPLPAQTAPLTGAARMVWIAESGGLVALDASDARVLLEIGDPAGVRAAAADDRRGVVWAYVPGSLRAYRFDGTLALAVTRPTPAGYTSTTPVTLAVEPSTGAVWLAVGMGLERRDAQGQLLLTLGLPEDVRALALDAARGRLWVGTATTLEAYDAAGQVVMTLDLGRETLEDLAFDPAAGRLWVALGARLRRYGADGGLQLDAPLPRPLQGSPKWVAWDGAGGAWVARPTQLVRVDSSGSLLVNLSPWPGAGPLVTLTADTVDASAWVASETTVTRVSGTGTLLQAVALWAGLAVRDLAFAQDLTPPTISFTSPVEGAALRTNSPTLEVSYADQGAGVDPATLAVTSNGVALAVTCTSQTATAATCTPATALADGAYTLAATVRDRAGNASTAAQVAVAIDTVAPVVTLTAPADGLLTNQPTLAVTGSVSERATVTLKHNGAAVQTVPLAADLTFGSSPVTLTEGANVLEVLALDAAGNQGSASRTVTLDTVAPPAVAAGAVTVGPVTNGQVTVTGAAGSVEAGTRVTVRNVRTGASVTVVAASDGSFSATLAAQAGDSLAITSTDAAGNTSGATTVWIVPPDPATVAPALDQTVATDLASATSFLYAGANPIQTGVAAGTIEARRTAVLRGVVRTHDGAALPGVTLTILNHPEFGQTLSRADGAFDLAVNGGSVLTVEYAKAGYLPARRQVQAPWQDFAHLPEVVLIPLDPQVTPITANATTMQVARGSVVTDADGSRRATLLVPAGTTATMVRPDGTTQSLSTLNVRATEYTVGATGPRAMPAELPPTSGYTYAVELSADEAVAAGATAVRFSQPLVNYVENFLGFPVGWVVPAGYYDRPTAAWVPATNGRVIKLLGIAGGLADLDLDGSGTAASAAALAALGVTDAERQELATLYAVGQTLWRVPVPHFTPWDYNWPFGPPTDAVAPVQPLTHFYSENKPTTQCRSILECQNQTLGEALAVTGVPFGLHYRSDRVPGRTIANTLTIPLSGASLPASLKRIDLEVSVAGRRITQSFPALPNQATTFTWDGRDAYGRVVQGTRPAHVRIGYVYPMVYYQARADFAASFAVLGSAPSNITRGAYEFTLWQDQAATLGAWDARAQGLGAWSLGVHHAYDPVGQVLYLGTGGRRSSQDVKPVITTVAGTGVAGFGGDGGPATQAPLNYPNGLALGPDGSLYVADSNNFRVRKVAPDGRITTVAGTGVMGFGGDGGPATQAELREPKAVAAGPDGSLYVGDYWRLRRVGPDGIIRTVACTGNNYGYGGDGGPATQATCADVHDIAVAPDGTLFFSDRGNGRVRRVGPDGIITTVAQLTDVLGLALAPDGSLYITGQLQVYRLGPDGRLTVAAGTGTYADAGDGAPATQARLFLPWDVAVGPDGSVYITDIDGANVVPVRRVGPDGIITAAAGIRGAGYSGDGGPALQAQLDWPWSVAVAPDGHLYVADYRNHRIRRVAPPLPGFAPGEIAIAAEDGGEVYVFDGRGRHLRTVDALTGAVAYRFAYDAGGRLVSVEDRVGLVTRLERDGAGNATALVAPGGQHTALGLDPNGYLASVTNPAGEATQLTYGATGLLATLTDARGNPAQFTYDAQGRLSRDDDRAGGFTTLANSETARSYTVTLNTGLNRTSTYRVEQLTTGATRRVDTDPSGVPRTRQHEANSAWTLTAPDGTVTRLVDGPDPRFGMQAPVAKSLTVTTPGGRQSTVTATRTATLADPLDPLSLTALTETVTLNGRAATTTWSAATRTLTARSPAGRQTVTTLDALGRVVRVEQPGLEPVSLTYDPRGRLETVTAGTGLAARVTTYGYDALDRLVSLRDPLTRVTTFDYDLADRVTVQTRPDTQPIGFGYDANGNVRAVTPPGRPAHGFDYTPVDLEASYTPPGLPDVPAPATAYAYNLDQQPTRVTRPDGQTLEVGYDPGGRLTTVAQRDATGLLRGETRLAYAATTGQLATVTAPDGGTLAYTYDGFLLTSVAWGTGPVTGSVSWTYDTDFRVASETVGGQAVSFGYDPDSLLTQAGALSLARDAQTGFLTGTTLGVVTDSRTYTTFGELGTYAAQVNGTSVLEVAYVRDALGRITEKTETVEGTTTVTGYRYDAVGRLDQVTTNGVVTATYTYDANGNRLSATTPGGTVTGTYDAQDRLLTYGSATYTYTANGELRTKTDASGTTTYAYDLVGNLTRVDLPDGRVIEYLIDGQNRRIGKKVNGVLVQGWLYRDQLKPVAELDGSGQVVARFVYGANPLVPAYVVKGGTTYHILADHLGRPRLVVDTATGVVIQRRDHDAWGRVTLDTNPGFQPFGFAGGLEDPDTGLVRFGARDYDSHTGRWTAKDPTRFEGGDTNLYRYASDDPVNAIDAVGLSEQGGVDYYTGTLNLGIPFTFNLLAFSPQYVVDKYGNIYVAPGLSVGRGLPGISGTFMVGSLERSCPPTEGELRGFLEGSSFSAGFGFVYGENYVWVPGKGKAREVGLSTPQAGLSWHYGIWVQKVKVRD